MEWLDIYDEHGNRTGKTAERGTFLSKGEYFLCAHVILENTDGLFLIQQRSDTKATRPGQWDITAGAVDCGEVSLDGALREAKEEVGLTLPREKMQFLFRDKRRSCYHDVYYIQIPFFPARLHHAGIRSTGPAAGDTGGTAGLAGTNVPPFPEL